MYQYQSFLRFTYWWVGRKLQAGQRWKYTPSANPFAFSDTTVFEVLDVKNGYVQYNRIRDGREYGTQNTDVLTFTTHKELIK